MYNKIEVTILVLLTSGEENLIYHISGQKKGLIIKELALTGELKYEYPFSQNSFFIPEGYKINYVDVGNPNGSVILMLHGNPTWSFYYRNLIKGLKADYRVIVPDHIGCGLSDKPQDYPYGLSSHIENTIHLLKHLNVERFHMVIHDWGGAIGMGIAVRKIFQHQSIILLNSAAFRSQNLPVPSAIKLSKIPWITEQFIRKFNLFSAVTTRFATYKRLDSQIRNAYLLPYQNYENRVAIAGFVKDIPLHSDHPSYNLITEIESKLHQVTCEKLILWGAKDFCLGTHFFNKWKEIYPESKHQVYPKAGHFVLEDEWEDILEQTKLFLEQVQNKITFEKSNSIHEPLNDLI